MKCRFFILFMLFVVLSGNAQTLRDCSTCSSELLVPKQLKGLAIHELQRLKDEVYARQGYIFANRKTTEYFSQYSWYKPVQRNSLLSLNDIEKYNVDLIDYEIESILFSFGKTPNDDRYLPTDSVDKLLTHQIKKQLGILFYNTEYIYPYRDDSGNNYLILSESLYDPYNDSKPLFSDYIKAICCVGEGSFLLKTYEINDMADTRKGELDIRFLPQYISADDLDGDGLVEPIIVYAAMGEKGYRDGWAKIQIMHKKVSYIVYINNSDAEKNQMISFSTNFYTLPDMILQRVSTLLGTLEADGFCYYPQDWKKMYDQHSLVIW